MQIGEIWPFLLPGVLLPVIDSDTLDCGVRERRGNRKPFHRAPIYLVYCCFRAGRHCILPASRRKDTAQRYHHRRSGKGANHLAK